MSRCCSLPSSDVSSGKLSAKEIKSETFNFSVRATVATHTRAAPARSRTRAHSDAVVPVVKTSSINKMSRFNIRVGSFTTNAPRRFSRRWCRVSPIWLLVSRTRSKTPVCSSNLSGRCTCRKAARAIVSAWLKPRCACLRLNNGTGSTAIFPTGIELSS